MSARGRPEGDSKELCRRERRGIEVARLEE